MSRTVTHWLIQNESIPPREEFYDLAVAHIVLSEFEQRINNIRAFQCCSVRQTCMQLHVGAILLDEVNQLSRFL